MINDIPLKIVQNLKIPYKYRRITTPYARYFKDYNIKEPLLINRGDLIDKPFTSKCTILFKYYKKYYYCPLFEELYKNCKSDRARATMEHSLTLRVQTNKIICTFVSDKRLYNTEEVKRLIYVNKQDGNNNEETEESTD